MPYIKMNLPQVYMCSPSWTLLPPPSPYHPSGSSQCTSPKHPVSCIEPGLVTHFIYDIIHISMPFSQIIPPSPSPTESKRLFYTFRIFLSNVTSDTGLNFPTFVLTHFGIMVILTLYDEVIFFCLCSRRVHKRHHLVAECVISKHPAFPYF